jgi:hypothetical protein
MDQDFERTTTVTASPAERMRELMEQSLRFWRSTGRVHLGCDGAVLLSCGAHAIRIEPAAPDLPFRWMVTIDDRRRGAVSTVAVLRQVRTALDPGYATLRARIALAPLVPP